MTDESSEELPEGRYVELPGRGTTFVRETGPADGAVLLLLHGWTACADLNWRAAYPALSERYRVVAPDLRGHARGIRAGGPFRLEDCADDAAALVEVLGIDRVTAVGYSMGGPVAQLLWKRHRALVEGLVLCATSQTFCTTARERAMFSLFPGASLTARRLNESRRTALAMRVMERRHVDPLSWRWAAESLASHDWLAILDAGREIGRFDSRPWASTIDVPTGVLVTMHDRVVPPIRQYELAAAIPDSTVHLVPGDHAVCLAQHEEFVPHLVGAVDSVAARRESGDLLAA
jgi:3-oxoadipate enol-lactonase